MGKKDADEKRLKRERKEAEAALAALTGGGESAGESAAAEAPESPDPRANTRRRGLLLLGAAVVVGLIVWMIYALLGADTQTTDDAYVAGNIVPVTAREAGTVIAIHADNTQGVKAGDTLVDLDPALADVQMAAAEAALGRAVRQVRANFAQVRSGDGAVAAAAAALTTARGDYARRKAAAPSGAVPAEDLAHAADQLHHAEAALALAQGQQAEAQATVSGTDIAGNPAVLAAIADVRRAAIAQGHMRITAPVDGVVAQRGVQIGEEIAGGMPLMTVVPLREVWVDANFRETQLENLRIGQPVTIKADAWGSSVVFHGRLAGLGAGSGSAFALLPPQNASGNWIKVVQRLPVRVTLDPKELEAHPLRIGLSVTVSVDTANHAGAPVAAAPAHMVAAQPTQPFAPEVEQRIRAIIATNGGGR
jgi:membrane fusion protein (multidrug efflux system)